MEKYPATQIKNNQIALTLLLQNDYIFC